MSDTRTDRIDAVGEDVRVQYRLDVEEGPTGSGDLLNNRTGIVVDVETTGRACGRDVIVEMAMRRFRFDDNGIITYLDRGHGWREDPGTPLPVDVARRTGLTDDAVRGRRIDEGEAARLLRSAAIVIAHDATFVRPAVERRLADLGNLDWACSMTQVDWPGRAFDGLSLGYLLGQAGWFHDAHRGPSDVDAVLQLLRHDLGCGRTALAELVERSARPSSIVRAVGASFDVKDALRDRGYRWDPGLRTWWKEIDDQARELEEFWLASNVYSAGRGARAMGPSFETSSSATRFRLPPI